MQTLSDEQKQTLKQWINAGLGLADIQRAIAENWNMSMTYMDVRFLVDDLGLDLKEEPKKSSEDKKSSEPTTPQVPAIGEVSVSLNKVQRPGAVASGEVTFSDGVSAQWQIDPMGQLGLIPSQEGYHPTNEDVREFQTKLQGLLA